MLILCLTAPFYVLKNKRRMVYKLRMAIKRKVRMAGKSLAVTIPSQIAQLHDINEGDYLEFTPIGYGEFKIRKVEK